MTIEEFYLKNKEEDIKPIEEICENWEKEKQIEDFLNVSITSGVTVGDYFMGDRMLDQISTELLEGFKHSLTRHNFQTYDQLREYMMKKAREPDGGGIILGLINNVKGKLGELKFKEEINELGLNAELSPLANQKGWDIKIPREDYNEYIQVKTRGDADEVIREIREVNNQLIKNEIMDGSLKVDEINFAVPRNILDELKNKLSELDIDNKIYDFDLTSDEAAQIVRDGFDNVEILAFSNFFQELLKSSATVFALNSLAQAFLTYRRSKDLNQIISSKTLINSIEPTLISTGSISSGLITESMLNQISMIGGLPTFFLTFSTTLATREILKRVARRQDYVTWMMDQIKHTNNLVLNLESLNLN